jgi:hypothetical protein
MSAEDHAMLFDIRERIARIEARQVHILEVMTDNKAKMDRIEADAHGLKGRVWLVSTIVFATLAAAWEIVKNRLLGH